MNQVRVKNQKLNKDTSSYKKNEILLKNINIEENVDILKEQEQLDND